MSSKEISMIAMEPFISKFVLTIIKTIRKHNLKYEEKHVIDADLVPKFSGGVMKASLTERRIPAVVGIKVPKVPKHQYRDMSALVAPIKAMLPKRAAVQSQALVVPSEIQSVGAVPQKPFEINRPMGGPTEAGEAPVAVKGVPVVVEKAPQEAERVTALPRKAMLSANYGKITPLLNDPSVSSIECQGAGKHVMIIRAGQRQVTRIVLSKDDIDSILQKVSDMIHIPLLEGVFRAATDDFSINAVISEMIGSRFVIKKQTAYALLEGNA